jgi:hypothetical protein
MSLYTLCGALTACISHLHFRHLSMKWSTKSSDIWRPFFRALLVSWGLLHAPGQDRRARDVRRDAQIAHSADITYVNHIVSAGSVATLEFIKRKCWLDCDGCLKSCTAKWIYVACYHDSSIGISLTLDHNIATIATKRTRVNAWSVMECIYFRNEILDVVFSYFRNRFITTKLITL